MSSRRPQEGRGEGGLPDWMSRPRIPQPGRGGDDQQARLPEDGDPVVLLDTELDDGKIWLVLANPGQRTAFEVKVDFAAPLKGLGGEVDVTRKRIFRGLPMLRPRSRIRILVDTARQLFADRDGRWEEEEAAEDGADDADGTEERETRFQARVSWRSRHGEALAQTFRHDLALWEDLGEVD